ncbi:MAG: TraR/DksA C4-type zinc finger protein [Alphaproteobacteria bacterium]|nr:MAG: TraR/DksA C4-type zinc finger protein [Alphaproteobacteria bacterium]
MNNNQKDYTPENEDDFMNEEQKSYFKKRLVSWKQSLLQERQKAEKIVEASLESDIADIAAKETEQSLALASKQRDSLLIEKIDQALSKIEDGSYGYCEETGEPIDINRLIARPIATLSLEAQEKKEKLRRFQTRRHA